MLSQLRNQGVFNISDVEFAMFEPGGRLSIQKKAAKQPLTPGHLHVPVQYDGLPTNLIMDGQILDDALGSLKLTKAWLYHQLDSQGLGEVEKISLAQLDSNGNLYVDLIGDEPYYIISTNSSSYGEG